MTTSQETWLRIGGWVARWALRATGPVVLVVLLVFVVDYGELRGIVGDLRFGWVIGAVALVQGMVLFRTIRWIEIHEAFDLGKASLSYQLRLTYATNLATLVLPQILNPFSRLILLMQDGFRARRAAAASVVEKLFDFASFAGFGLYGSIFLASEFEALLWWAVGAVVAGVGLLVVAYLARSHLDALIAAFLPRVPGFRDQAGGEGSGVLQQLWSTLNVRVIARLLFWSFFVALTQASMLYFLSRSLGVGLSYPYMVATWGVIALTMLLPLSVNGLGTREGVLVVAFSAVDGSTDAAVALGLLILVVVAIGSSPGALEWLQRFLAPKPAPVDDLASQAAAAAPPSAAMRAGGADSPE